MLSALRNKTFGVASTFKLLGLRSLNTMSIARFAAKDTKEADSYSSSIAHAENKTTKEEVNPRSYQALKNNHWLVNDQKHTSSYITHKSNSEQYIHKIPVIYVDGNVARCIGGTKIGAGHPQVYLQLNKRNPHEPATCSYCGLKFQRRPHKDHESHGREGGESHEHH